MPVDGSSLVSQPVSDIRRRQNHPRMLTLLRAMSTSHARAQRLEALRLYLSAAIAVLGLFATLFSAIATVVTIIGGLWALIHSIGLLSWTRKEVERAALLQEMFDVQLFRLPWNAVLAGDPLAPEEVSKMARGFRGRENEIRDYYEVPDLPRPFDVLACQEQNLSWGARIRQRYAFAVLMLVILWSAAGVLLGSLLGVEVADLVLRFYVPSLGALMMGLEIYHAQQLTAVTRLRILPVVHGQITQAMTHSGTHRDLMIFARQVQDVIFQTRTAHTRVPNYFFLRYRLQDRLDFQQSMRELSQLVNKT